MKPENYRIGNSCFTCIYREPHVEIDKCELHNFFVSNVGVCDDWVEDEEWKRKQLKALQLVVFRYLLYEGQRGYRVFLERTSKDMWAIRDEYGYCFDKKLNVFVEEPSPSNRTDEFLKNSRWDSVECAISDFNLYKSNI